MTLHGKVQNGVVVLDGGAQIPEGTPVEVVIGVAPSQTAPSERMSEEERQRVLAIVAELVALPDENPGDTFRGADHDKVLYGEP